jgi:hypothetical protein
MYDSKIQESFDDSDFSIFTINILLKCSHLSLTNKILSKGKGYKL